MMDRQLSKRIQIARYLMVCGIIFIHVPPIDTETVTNNAYFLFFRAFWVDAVFRGTVPVLTCISAYLIFLYSKDKKPLALIRSKAESIVLPMIIWNLPVVLVIYLMQKYGVVDYPFRLDLYPFKIATFLDATFGITDRPANFPLFFLRDLFVLAVLAPIFGFFIHRAPVLGFAVVAAIFWFDFDSYLLLRSSMALNFYIGGVAAVHGWNLFLLDRYRWIILFFFIVVCLIKCQVPGDSTFFRLLSPFMIWPILGLFENSRFGDFIVKLSPGSFFLFLAHAPMLIGSYILYKMFSVLEYPLYWFVASTSVIVLCAVLYRLSSKAMPSAMQVALGGR
jgi:Acyltransferase family